MAQGSTRPAIGIDLGTAYSCVGVWRNNRVEIIANEQGRKTTPSCVAFTDTHRLIGDGANYQATRNCKNTIFDAKRLMGRRFNDDSVQRDLKRWPFEVICGGDEKPKIVVQYKGERKGFCPEEISSFVLTKMVNTAQNFIGSTVEDVVITVPAYFDGMQRQATIDAGVIAGLNVMRLMTEPTAAAMAYDASKKPDNLILIFDLGGGTFDISIVRVTTGDIHVIATDGDNHLGGTDIDNNMVEYFFDEIKRRHNTDIRGNPKAVKKLRDACERAKRTLSVEVQTTIDIDSLHQDIDFSSTISRALFETLNMDLFKKCMDIVDKCLTDNNMDRSQIDDIVLVGGSTKIPKVQAMLQEFFNGKELCQGINPDEAVAYGAAIQAAYLSNNKTQDVVLQDVTPLSFGTDIRGYLMDVLIPRNTKIPTKVEKVYFTTTDKQENMSIEVYMGERPYTKDNKLLDKFILSGIPPAPRGASSVTVCFEINYDGILTVTAVDNQNGNKMEVTMANDNCKPRNEEIRRMVTDAGKYKEEDEIHKENVKAKNELEKQLLELKNALLHDDTIKTKAKKKIEIEIGPIEEWLQKNERLAEVEKFRLEYNEHVDRLNKAIEISNQGSKSSTLSTISIALKATRAVFQVVGAVTGIDISPLIPA